MSLKGIYLVTWIDSCSSGKWRNADELKQEMGLGPIISCGFLIENTKTHVALVQSFSQFTANCSDMITIPKAAVLSIKKLASMPKRHSFKLVHE